MPTVHGDHSDDDGAEQEASYESQPARNGSLVMWAEGAPKADPLADFVATIESVLHAGVRGQSSDRSDDNGDDPSAEPGFPQANPHPASVAPTNLGPAAPPRTGQSGVLAPEHCNGASPQPPLIARS